MGPPPTPFGGVPGINPPNFDAGTTITNAIKDIECRFSIQASSDVACTRNNFGDFAFRGAGTRTQFCFQVPMTAAFQAGDTLVRIQLRDVAGNIGPLKEFVVRIQP